MRIHFRETDTSAGKALQAWLSWEKIRLQCRRPGFDSWVGKIPWRREGLPTPVFLPGEFWVAKSQTRLNDFHFHHLCFEIWFFLLAVYAILDEFLNPSSYWKLQFPTCKMRIITLNMQDYWSNSKCPTQIPIFAHCIF